MTDGTAQAIVAIYLELARRNLNTGSAGNVRAAAMTSAAQKCDGNFMRFLLLCWPAYSAPARQVCPETGQQPD